MFLNFKLFCAVVLALSYASAEKHVVCYYGTWATYRWGLGKFDVADINPALCTHAVYTFVGLDSQGNVVSLDPYLDLPDNWGRNNFASFNALKQKNPDLKTILAVGGWNEGSAKFSVMAASAAYRQNFISSAISMLQTHGFDGLDVDWEYPNRRDSVNGQADIDNYTQLLKELREEFDKYGLMLSAAVSSVRDMASLSYDIPAISGYLDLINVMTYDMYGAWDSVTGHNAPLHKGEGDENVEKDDLYTFDVALQYWLDQGAPAEKIVIGVPFYGRTFTLSNASNTAVRAPVSGPGLAGPYTATNGVIGYNEFCVNLQSESWTQEYDELAKVPYAYSGQNWVSYDNVASITQKIQYAMSYNIGGVMIWSIETDDFHGACGGGVFPLLRAVNVAVDRDISSAEVTAIPTSTTTQSSVGSGTTSTSSTSTVCSADGFAPDPKDCSAFYMCVQNVDGSFQEWKFQCPNDLQWDQANSLCNYPKLVGCEQKLQVFLRTIDIPTTRNVCNEEGLTPDPEDCSSFFMCVKNDDGSFQEWKFQCPNDLQWDQANLKCNYPELVECHQEPHALSRLTNTPAARNVCNEEGLTSDPEDCSSFFMCMKNDDGSFQEWKLQCPNDLQWDQANLQCNYPELVECDQEPHALSRTTNTPAARKVCNEEGLTSDPEDCTSFYMCVKNDDGSLQEWKMQCPNDLQWDQANSMCNYPDLVECHSEPQALQKMNSPTTRKVCTQEGPTPDPQDCGSFYMCVKKDDGTLQEWKMKCPNGLQWDQANSLCNYPELVQCNV